MSLGVRRVVIAIVVVAGIAVALVVTRKVVPPYVPTADPSPTATYSTELTGAVFADTLSVRDTADVSKFIALTLAERGEVTDCPLVDGSERCVGAVAAVYLSPGGEFRLTAVVFAFDEVIGAREVGDALEAADDASEVIEPSTGVPASGWRWWMFGDLSRFVVVTTAGLASGETPDEAEDDAAAWLSVRLYDKLCLQVRLGYR